MKDVSARWLKASRALKKEDQVYGQRLAEMAKKHSSEAFYALDDPLEAAVFSVMVEIVKERFEETVIERYKRDFSQIGFAGYLSGISGLSGKIVSY